MIEAEFIVRSLGGDWRANAGLAPCPICQPEGRRDQRALSIRDAQGKTLLTCHKTGCVAADLFRELRGRGIANDQGALAKKLPAELDREREQRRRQKARTRAHCEQIFREASPITGTPAETYLENRRLAVQGSKLRNTLRFHPALWHTASDQNLPCLLARVRGPDGRPVGLHRTYLRSDGTGKAEVTGPRKLMLGSVAGGAVRFGPDRQVIALAEGIETSLSIGMASRLTVWACLSTSGMKGVILPSPPIAEVVVIAADHDPAGLDAAEVTATRLEAEGRAVSIIMPPSEGTDFNDLLQSGRHE